MSVDPMSRSIPKSIDYQDVLPVAVPAIARRRRYFAQNGSVFNFFGSNEIRIEIGSANSLLDTRHSYMEIDVANNSGQSFGFDVGGAHCLFESVRVEQGGRVLSETQSFNRLCCSVLNVAQDSTDGSYTQSITEAGKGGSNQVGGLVAQQQTPATAGIVNVGQYSNTNHNNNTQVPAAAVVRMSFPVIQGLFNQDKLIPLPLVRQDSPITLIFRLTNPINVGAWSAGIAANAIEVRQVNYVAQLIEVGGDVINQIREVQGIMGGQLAISSTDIEHSQGNLPANSAGEQPIRVPLRKRSMKSLFFCMQSDDYTNGAAGLDAGDIYNLSYAGSANIESYQIKCGAVVYPPTPINCWGNVAQAAGAQTILADCNRSECFMELAKALGSLSFVNPTGRICSLNYGVNNNAIAAPRMSDGDNGDGAGPPGNTQAPGSGQSVCICPFGLDLDAFQHTALEAGLDSETMSKETNLLLNIAGVLSGIEAKNVHVWVLYDQHYYFNSDGHITFSN